MDIKISVIVPVFNTEQYLNRCLESIVNQTYKNIEVILVDDGSEKVCSDLCDVWAKKDERIQVVHKQNEGLGYARNTGIQRATGEFLFFIDSDDYLDESTIECCKNCAEETAAEIVCYGFSAVNRNGKIVSVRIPEMPKRIYEGEEICKILLPEMLGDNPKTGKSANIEMSAWAAMFSAKLIRQAEWKFVSEREIISEDVYSILSLYKHVQRVCILNKAFYFYCENQNSLTHIYKEDRYQKIKQFYTASLSLIEQLEYGEEMKERLKELYLSFFIGAAKTIVRASMSYAEKIKKLKSIIEDEQMQEVLFEANKFVMNRNKALFFQMARKKRVKVCYLLLWLQCRRK